MAATIFVNPEKRTACSPESATAAPAKPPISAWEELVGSPAHHVIKSQAIAPTNPHITTLTVTKSGATIPFAIILATAVPKANAATKLKNAAQATAFRGVKTRVETTVAIEFAAS